VVHHPDRAPAMVGGAGTPAPLSHRRRRASSRSGVRDRRVRGCQRAGSCQRSWASCQRCRLVVRGAREPSGVRVELSEVSANRQGARRVVRGERELSEVGTHLCADTSDNQPAPLTTRRPTMEIRVSVAGIGALIMEIRVSTMEKLGTSRTHVTCPTFSMMIMVRGWDGRVCAGLVRACRPLARDTSDNSRPTSLAPPTLLAPSTSLAPRTSLAPPTSLARPTMLAPSTLLALARPTRWR
jgi:hypothetical protein